MKCHRFMPKSKNLREVEERLWAARDQRNPGKPEGSKRDNLAKQPCSGTGTAQMTDPGNPTANAPKMETIEAGFIRLLSGRIHDASNDPRQMRAMVYELARSKLLQQFTHADAWDAREFQQVLERAIGAVEKSFEQTAAPAASNTAADVVSAAPSINTPSPAPTAPTLPFSNAAPVPRVEEPRPRTAPPRLSAQGKRSGVFNALIRLTVSFMLVACIGVAAMSWPRLRSQFTASSPLTASRAPQPQPTATPVSSDSEVAERPESPKEAAPAPRPSMPLPASFGVYALSEGQLQELKPVPGKIPDRRVAISAAINMPSATTLTSGDVKFIVFRPDGGVDASGTEVRVVAKVSRAMGVDASGKASIVSGGDSWVIRSMSFPYKVGPVENQPRMLLLQPEQDGFTLTPGRYVVVVKGAGYDFTVPGAVTDPNQCVERINAANGAFYSPCPPAR